LQFLPISQGIFDETYVSTQSAAAPPHSWFSRPHANEERAHRAEAPSRKGPQAAHRVFIAVKLRRRAEFIRVYDRGSRYRGRLMTCFALPNEVGMPRLGIAASQKIGNAVVRNRAKRLARELFRSRKPLSGLDIVIIPKREMVDAPWRSIEADYRAALERFERK
jgi:ribonuclease P protein component